MAIVSAVFQNNVFQDNAFQDNEWGTYTFQPNVFQRLVFDRRPQIVKLLNETLAITELSVKLGGQLRYVNETESMSEVGTNVIGLIKFVNESESIIIPILIRSKNRNVFSIFIKNLTAGTAGSCSIPRNKS